MKICSNCFMLESRPRITFNKEGKCNACQWAEEKKTIDWDERQKYFGKLCNKYSGNGREPDCIVPWSGGKDSIYVAYKMREFGMTPLLITILPHLETEIGAWNRKNTCTDFEHLEVVLDEEKYRKFAKECFVEQGRPKHPWEVAISAVVINKVSELNLPFIIYGEDGEQEYGGVSDQGERWKKPVDLEYLRKYYWQNRFVWDTPNNLGKIFFTQYSRFEDWSPSNHGDFAVFKGMRIRDKRSIGTYTKVNQLSDKLQDLHCYLMYLKFGFGRCTSDVCIAIREGGISRKEARLLIDKYDGEYPELYEKDYLKYFGMTRTEFLNTLRGFRNESR